MDTILGMLKGKWKSCPQHPQNVIKQSEIYNENLLTVLSEREEDIKQIQEALKLYNLIFDNFNKATKLDNINGWNFKNIVGFDVCLLFYDKVEGIFCAKVDIDGKKDVPSIFVGPDEYDVDYINSPIRFWIEFKDYLIHELIHINDFKEIKVVIPSDSKSPDYFTNPHEFNAYFVQISTVFFNSIKSIKEINPGNDSKLKAFLGNDHKEFIKTFWDYVYKKYPKLKSSLNDKYKFKWNKRIYQLYDELKKYFNK